MTTNTPVADDALPEPVGYLSLREADLLASGHTAMLRSAKFGPSKLDHDAPLYTADQLRAAIAAERHASAAWEKRARDYGWPDCGGQEVLREQIEAGDHIRAGLEAEVAALRNDIAIALKALAEYDAENAKLRDRLADAARDAARYRWLRHGDNDEGLVHRYISGGRGHCYLLRNDALDDAIDNARKERP